ncbi:MAG: hypothetical protein RLZZ292_3964, partial [Bacteroidota bacterium]
MHYFSERLKSARKRNGFSLQDVADHIGISKQALSKYESGDTRPDSEIVSKLCGVLHVRPDYFVPNVLQCVELSCINFRKFKDLGQKEQERVVAEAEAQIANYLELEILVGLESRFENPFSDTTPFENVEQVELFVEALRKKWAIGEEAIHSTIDLLESKNIKVIELEAEEDFAGLSAWVGQVAVIVLNKNTVIPSDRKRFTALHELGHLLMKEKIKHLPSNEQEIYCNTFAAALLLSKRTLLQQLGEHRQHILWNELAAIKLEYGISMQAIMIRSKTLNIISTSNFEVFKRLFSQAGYKKIEPVQYEGKEYSLRFMQLIYRG